MGIWRKWSSWKATRCLLVLVCALLVTAAIADDNLLRNHSGHYPVGVENPTNGMANDLLQLPALQSELAASSLLLDVSRAGSRLVVVGERGHIVFSDDGGERWLQAEVPVSVTLTAVSFPLPELGWAVGHDSVVLHTSDAGRTWRLQMDGHDFSAQMVAAVKRIVEKRRAALENAPDELRDELALNLEDAEFFLSDVVASATEGAAHPFMDVWFINELEGLLFGAFGMIFRTEDGGETWTAIADHIESAQGFHYYAAGETANGALLAVGETGTLIRSADRGRTWRKLESPYPGSLFGLVTDPRSSCAVGVGLRGNVVRICEEGFVLEALSSLSEEALTGGVVLLDGTMVVVGMAPMIHVSRDNGRTFQKVPTRFPGCMAVADIGDGTLLLVGVGGVHKMNFLMAENSRQQQ